MGEGLVRHRDPRSSGASGGCRTESVPHLVQVRRMGGASTRRSWETTGPSTEGPRHPLPPPAGLPTCTLTLTLTSGGVSGAWGGAGPWATGTGKRQVARQPHLLQGDEGGQRSVSPHVWLSCTGREGTRAARACGPWALAWQPRAVMAGDRTRAGAECGGARPGRAPGAPAHHTLLALVWSTTSRLQCTSSTSSGAIQRSGTHSWSAVTK